MKLLGALCFICMLAFYAVAQQDAATIKQQMAKIRQSTNWEDPAAAKKANEQIRELAKKLMMTGMPQGNQGGGQGGNQTQNQEKSGGSDQNTQDVSDMKIKMIEQIIKSAAGGKGADVLLADPVREEIKEEYRQDEAPKVGCSQFQEEMTVLCIDMSSPVAQLIIDQMENFKSIKTLVITGGKLGKPVNLETLLTKAENYPLEQLYIINFGIFVNKIPKSIRNFPQLTFLALYNNKITSLPPELSSLVALKKLYVDMNPVTNLTPIINSLNHLDTLGIAKTQVSEAELNKIKQQLPKCKILLQ
ncbi:MAG: leucine-rich repeat domain-containing protein [Prolixibacteraceae bacterium]